LTLVDNGRMMQIPTTEAPPDPDLEPAPGQGVFLFSDGDGLLLLPSAPDHFWEHELRRWMRRAER